MKRVNYLQFLIVGLALMGCQEQTDLVVNDEDAVEVSFDDVATNIKVIPLESEEPIGSIRSVICYDDELIALDNDQKTVYYFKDGVLVSKMNHEGRGRGEYIEIRRYGYSPSRKVIYVLADDKILWYSVPKMSYCGNTPINKQVNFFTLHDDNQFFATLYHEGKYVTALIDIETGKVNKVLGEISMHNAEESDLTMASYSPFNHYYALSDHDNSIFEVTSHNDAKMVLQYNFGNKSIPAKYMSYDPLNLQPLADFFEYMSQEGKTRLQGNVFLKINDSGISFWYNYSVGSKGIKYYYRFNKKDNTSTNLKGFYTKGLNRPITPFAVSNNGYITVFQGDPGWFKTDETPSTTAKSILHELENQKNNNPVLLFYDIK